MKSRLMMCVLAVVLAVTAGCTRREVTCVGDASITGAEVVVIAPPPFVPVAPAPAPAPPEDQGPSAARTENAPLEGPVPSWVPDAGRLTIVQAPDLARNLGIAPAAGVPDASSAGPEAPR